MILSVGGWDKGSEGFSKLVSSRENMLKFTDWVIIYLRRFDFDGLDFDWQFPALRDSSLQDKKRFADLCDVSFTSSHRSWETIFENYLVVSYYFLFFFLPHRWLPLSLISKKSPTSNGNWHLPSPFILCFQLCILVTIFPVFQSKKDKIYSIN